MGWNKRKYKGSKPIKRLVRINPEKPSFRQKNEKFPTRLERDKGVA